MMMPQSRARGAGQDRLGRIEGPAGAGRPARHEETGHQHEHGEQIDPVAQHVDVGEHHVPGADHQRDQVVAEPAQEQRGEQVDHHDHAVHGDELVVLGRVDDREGVREAELQPHQPGQHERDETDRKRGDRILDRDHLGVLAEYVSRPPAVGMVEFDVLDLGRRDGFDHACCGMGHQAALLETSLLPLNQPIPHGSGCPYSAIDLAPWSRRASTCPARPCMAAICAKVVCPSSQAR